VDDPLTPGVSKKSPKRSPRATPGGEYDGPVARAIGTAVRRARELKDERRRTASVFAGLVAGERRVSDLVPEDAALLRGVAVIDLLLEQSRRLRFHAPDEMVRLTELALLAVERLDRAQHGDLVIADLRARTWGELGNARRVSSDLDAAEDALRNATAWARRGTGDPLLAARIGDLYASLHSDQRRFSEAARILHLVQAAYRAVGDDHLAGRALISRGSVLGNAGQPREALAAICDGLGLVDLDREPELELLALHNMVFSLVETGEYRQARIVLGKIRPLYRRQGDDLNLLRLRWLEGKIDSGLGELGVAESHFEAVRQGFAERGQTYDEALVGLDLAMLWARQGRRAEVAKLAADLAEGFRAMRITRETLASLIILREWCDCAWVPDDVIQDQIRVVTALMVEMESRGEPRRVVRASRRSAGRDPRH
jgi:tetratricopeptide (TPR) repeat protein